MTVHRREALGAGLGLGAGVAALLASPSPSAAAPRSRATGLLATELGVVPDAARDQTEALQRAIDTAASVHAPLLLPPGRIAIGGLRLPAGAVLIGASGTTVLVFEGIGGFVTADTAAGLRLEDLTLDGGYRPLDPARSDGLLDLRGCLGLTLLRVGVRQGLLNGVSLRSCSGRIEACRITDCGNTALFSLDSLGLAVTGTSIEDIGNNGIQIWRTDAGADGSTLTGNRIARVAARAGGTGQNGNGINIYRAGSVLAADNRITDCAFSAIRSNAGGNCQMIGNACERLGEVALYAEFGFDGAVIASNLVDGAAQGISVTNFNEGGRLAVVQGNLVRNTFRREESEDKRGIGIAVEADAAVTGNVVEGAPTVGILAGWGRFRRDIAISGNVVRNAHVGIGVSGDPDGGPVLIAQNLVSGSAAGAIRLLEGDRPVGPEPTGEGGAGFPNISVLGNLVG